jgi:phosphate transport system protein
MRKMTKIKKHIIHDYDLELKELVGRVLSMGEAVLGQLNDAVTALLQDDVEVAKKVASSDYIINKMEVDIDEECVAIIATRQPAAGDLRLVISVIKVITDFERIGDEAEKIGRFISQLSDQEILQGYYKELKHTSKISTQMLQGCIESYKNLDAKKAKEILKLDKELNHEFENLSRLLITHMMEDNRNIKNMLRISWCARALERVGDHSKNICEYVIYLVKGKDIRHTGKLSND